jgi:arsenical pump membrane protein
LCAVLERLPRSVTSGVVTGAAAETLAVVLLAASLVIAVLRPFGWSEAFGAVPAAAILVAARVVPWRDALDSVERFGPTVGFLAAILVFGHLCAEAGVFDYLGSVAAEASRGSPRRLLLIVVALAALVTAVLTLDATVVLLTPVVLTTVRELRVPVRPHAYACTRLANSGSLLLPVSNLTNLLAFGASGLSFGRFAALMTLPWGVAVATEWLALRSFFRRDVDGVDGRQPARPTAPPYYALSVLAVSVAGFVITSGVHVAPAWAAVGGCVLLLMPRMRARDVSVGRLFRETSPGFCIFVLALAVVVDGVTRHGLSAVLRKMLPDSTGLAALLLTVLVAAVLANLVNNLPATLALVPLVTGNPALLLAVLLGVNIGPNATYPGSLATLLWRRSLPSEARPRAGQFHLFGALSVPLVLAISAVALWVALRVIGA